MTQKASCRERSASPTMSLLAPRTSTVTVVSLFRQPVILTMRPEPSETSSTRSAWPSFSGTKLSTCATGRQPVVREINSMSLRSTSVMTMIFILARKWSERSLVASRRIDFCTSRTLHPVSLILLQSLRMYLRSSRRMRSMAAYSDTTTLFSMSVFGAERQNWMRPILAFSTRLGAPETLLLFFLKTSPSTSSVSSTVPPTCWTTRMFSLISTLLAVSGLITRSVASTAIGERICESPLTTLELSEVVAA
mmetsp:Transcript_5125/g.13160  ORF Transcript_5125/g.13160 Transcript_5125/m.13160 type:complete len:250 (+) Transcript_5125:495-1244(+)